MDQVSVGEVQAMLGLDSYRQAWDVARSGALGPIERGPDGRALLVERRGVEHYLAWQRTADVIDAALAGALKLAPCCRDMMPSTCAGLRPDDLPRAVTAWGLACVSAAATAPAQRILRELEADAAEAEDRGEAERAAWLRDAHSRLVGLRFEATPAGELRPIASEAVPQ
jgi:hypothetical protein